MNQNNNALVATPSLIAQVAALQAQLAALQVALMSICPNDGSGRIEWVFQFNHGDIYRVYFLNDINSTGFVDLTSVENADGYKYIHVAHKYHNLNGVLVKPTATVKNEINGATQLGLYYPTGENKTNIIANQNGVRSNFNNQQGGNYNAVLATPYIFSNSHVVKVIKIA